MTMQLDFSRIFLDVESLSLILKKGDDLFHWFVSNDLIASFIVSSFVDSVMMPDNFMETGTASLIT